MYIGFCLQRNKVILDGVSLKDKSAFSLYRRYLMCLMIWAGWNKQRKKDLVPALTARLKWRVLRVILNIISFKFDYENMVAYSHIE